MPLIFLIGRSAKLLKIVRTPAFGGLSKTTQKGILRNYARETAIGYAGRKVAYGVIGLVVDPYNNFVVPLSQGILIKSDDAVTKLFDMELNWKEDFQAALALQLDPQSFAISIVAQAFDYLTTKKPGSNQAIALLEVGVEMVTNNDTPGPARFLARFKE